MASEFGTVAIPLHIQQEGLDLDALLPGLTQRVSIDERNPPTAVQPAVTGLVGDLMKYRADVLDRFPNVRVISFAATGIGDWVDVPEATRRGIAVCNVPGWGNDSIAEYTFALLLSVAKRLPQADAMARDTVWREEEITNLELRGLTIGLLGLGNIGERVAEIADAFGLTVLCYTRTPERQRTLRANVEFVPLDELLRRSNILSLHTKLTDETRHLIGARELDLLPDGAILVNTARGAVLDTDALVAALKRGKLWGAGLDVFEDEPLPAGHPLRELDNVVLSPHVAGQSDTARRKRMAICISNIAAFAAGTPANVVNPEVLR
jgi:phosphoglycerate dehydrogenase-like enzyme